MKTPQEIQPRQRRQKGIALIIVISVIALMTVLTVAMFSVSETERASSSQQADQEQARELADVATNIVMGQIWQATRQDGGTGIRQMWASQPGSVRKYNQNGSFHSGYRTYSSSRMVVTGTEDKMVKTDAVDTVPGNWNTMPARYVDLNEPVIRPPLAGAPAPTVYFPIIDPRAYVPTLDGKIDSPNVEGFYYGNTDITGKTIGGVKPASSVDDSTARLAMPVEWMYVLKDGTLGTLNFNNKFVKPDGAVLSVEEAKSNPIVGRVAFWTDDESCKLNINTASEPTYWTTPSLYHDRDLWWAFYQPTTYEYQRYPGHPATVALSTVLFPNQDLEIYGKAPGTSSYDEIIRKKESIYLIAPKITVGGSKVGTEAYWKFADNYNGYTSQLYKKYVNLTDSIKERLYASVDELYFAPKLSGGKRVGNTYLDVNDGPTGTPMFALPGEAYDKNRINLDRIRFFLTAQSRVPEVTMFGTPRVAIWPIADENGICYQDEASGGATQRTKYRGSNEDYRTGYDKLIAFCSSLGDQNAAYSSSGSGKSYYFRRRNAYSATDDINISRNLKLMSYLNGLLQQTMPGGASFAAKYPKDYTQILVEIFDYIRATNLYDGFLSPTKEELQKTNGVYSLNNGKFGTGTGEISNDGNIYRNRPTDFRTYTYDRASASTTRGGSLDSKVEQQVEQNFPGHGMVVPTDWNGYKGFGRFVTITEAGFHFICTADGNQDKGDYVQPVPDGKGGYKPGTQKSGGRTALKMVRHTGGGAGTATPLKRSNPFTKENQNQFWYSNFPPYPTPQTMVGYGVDPKETNPAKPTYPGNHPGCIPENWNATLERGSDPLKPGQRRIQGMLVLNINMPAAGSTELNPEFSLIIKGLDKVELNGSKLYDASDARLVWKSHQSLFDATDCRPLGGNASLQAMTVGRRIGSHAQVGIIADVGYDASANTGGDPHRGTKNFDLTTKFVTVTTNGQSPTMQFQGQKLTVELYSSHLTTAANLCQTFEIDMTQLPKVLPVPELVTASLDHEQQLNADGTTTTEDANDAPHWWALNYTGALGRYAGAWDPRLGWGSVSINTNLKTGTADASSRTLGRFFNYGGNDRATWANMPRGGTIIWAYEPASGNFNSNLLNPSSPGVDNPADLVSDTGLSDMQPSSTGTPRDSRGQDTIVTMVASAGDARLIATKKTYSDFIPHPRAKFLNQNVAGTGSSVAFRQFVAHSLSRFYSDRDPGYDRGSLNTRLVYNANYNTSRIPDMPSDATKFGAVAWKYGDFDNGGFASGLRDGAYINKPDEGDAAITFHYYGSGNSQTVRLPNAYLATWDYGWLFSDTGESFMTPNRMVPSPGMFGSLPTGVNEGVGWRTLLFRPNMVTTTVTGSAFHPGAAGWQKGKDPADHYIMDLFWMPIVEPYAISEPFSTAGKVNINYQMLPFTHIRRATGLHAVLKGEMIKAVPLSDAPNYNVMPGSTKFVTTQDQYTYRQPWTDITANQVSGANKKVWHRNIEVEKRIGGKIYGTLQQFEDRFNFVSDQDFPSRPGGLFRTASQICEVALVPRKVTGVGDGDDSSNGNASIPYSQREVSTLFWANRQMTGDNTKERPYANIYGKISTKSNTFRVHYRAQVIRKARSSQPEEFVPGADSVLTDYRGSTLIERRIDPSDSRIPDYAAPSAVNQPSLDDFYRFRVIEVKRFLP